MKKQVLIGASLMLISIASNAQQLWDDFDGLPSPAISSYTYVDGGWGQANFAFTNPNSNGNSSSTCLQYTKPASTYQKIYIGAATGYSINDVAGFKSGANIFTIKMLNAAATAITVQIGLNDNSKTGGSWPAGRHSTYTATTTSSTDWQTLTFAYDNAVSEDATVGSTQINEIIIEINGSSSSSVVYLLDDLTLANVSATTSVLSSNASNNLFNLEQNAPNPFNGSTKISYSLNESSEVSLEVLDVLGNKLYTLANGSMSSGEFSTEFNSKGLQKGVYYYRLKAGSFIETKKMILID